MQRPEALLEGLWPFGEDEVVRIVIKNMKSITDWLSNCVVRCVVVTACNELAFFDVFSYPPISRDRCYLHYDPDTSCAPVTSGKGRAIAVETLDDSVDDNDDDGNHYCLL